MYVPVQCSFVLSQVPLRLEVYRHIYLSLPLYRKPMSQIREPWKGKALGMRDIYQEAVKKLKRPFLEAQSHER